MNKYNKVKIFESVPIPKAVPVLAVPTVVSSLITVLYNLTDTYFVGLVNDPIQTAAVSLAAPVLLAFNAVTNLFGVGTSSLISRALGLKNYEQVKRASAVGFYGTLLAGILFSVLCAAFRGGLLNILGTDAATRAATDQYMFWTVYLGAAPSIVNIVMAYIVRSEGAALHACIGTVVGCILNIGLDPLFVLPGMGNMGASGAGLATMISNVVSCIYFGGYLFLKRKDSFLTISPRYFRPNVKIIKEICNVGIPASIQNLLNVLGMTLLNNFSAPYGADAVSAVGISHKIAMVPLDVSLGYAQGIMPLVGYNYANGNSKRMKSAIKFSLVFMMPVLIIICGLIIVFSGPIFRLFMEDPDVVRYGSVFLKESVVGIPMALIDFMAVNIFQAIGKGHYSFIFAIVRKLVLEIPAQLVLNMIFPLYGLAFAQSFAEIILGIIAVFMIRKIFYDADHMKVQVKESVI